MATRSDTDQRTEQPTVLRLAEARRRGQVARSADLTGVTVLLAVVVVGWLAGGVLLRESIEMVAAMLSFAPLAPGAGVATGGSVWSASGSVVWIAVCFCGVIAFAALLAGIAQVGLHISGEVIAPRWDRLSPGQGLRRIFSSRGLVGLALAAGKIAAVGLVAVATIGGQLPQIVSDCGLGLERQGAVAWAMLGLMAWRIVLVLAVLGAIDWAFQWRKHRSDLMMTRREVLEDLRKTEGDPRMRSRLRKDRRSDTPNDPVRAGDES